MPRICDELIATVVCRERERTIDITLLGWLGNGWVIFELVQFNDFDQTSSQIRNEFVAAIRGRVLIFERRSRSRR